MKHPINLNIKTPCQENFNNFTPTKDGGFCGSCQQEVIDFTTMNTEEIISYFKNRNTQNTCGRFKNSQLKSFSNNTHVKKKVSLGLFSYVVKGFCIWLNLIKLRCPDGLRWFT